MTASQEQEPDQPQGQPSRLKSMARKLNLLRPLKSWWAANTWLARTAALLITALVVSTGVLGWKVYQLTRPEPADLCGHLPTTELVAILGYQPRHTGAMLDEPGALFCQIGSKHAQAPAQPTSLTWRVASRAASGYAWFSKDELIKMDPEDPNFSLETDIPDHPEAVLITALEIPNQPCVYWAAQDRAVSACALMQREASPSDVQRTSSMLRTLVVNNAPRYLSAPAPMPSPSATQSK